MRNLEGTTKRFRADLSLALCSLLWGATLVVVKNSLDYSSVFLFLSVRFTLAALLMASFHPYAFRTLKKEELLAGAALGSFMFGGYAFQTAGLQYTTPAKSGFVTGSSVVLVPLLLRIFWKRRLTPWVYGGVFAVVFGLYFLTVPAEGIGHLNRGELLTFVAAGLYAMHIILVGDYHSEALGCRAQRAPGRSVRSSGVARNRLGLRGWLAAAAFRLAGKIPSRYSHLCAAGDRGGLLHSALGAAVYDFQPRGDPFHA
jgi:drug/metabolite transporter (DMT)-like permease